MSRKPASIRKEAMAALDAIAGYEPMLPRNIVLPARGADVLSKDVGRARDMTRPAPAADAPAQPMAAEDPREDVYGEAVRRNIQGNIIPGFNKDHQHFLFYRITDVSGTKKFLRAMAPVITSMDEVLEFVRAHRTLRLKLGVAEPPGLKATWVNIAFSCRGIEKLGAGTGEQFGEQSFRQGLAERSTYLGDPTDPSHPGHRNRWKVGGPHNEADILVIVASDTTADLERRVGAVRRSAGAARLDLIFEQRGDTLPGNLRGHEHFGFKDGVSQPGIRGKVSDAPGDFITPHYIVAAGELDQHPFVFAKPGQPLVWPGQFLLGEPRQGPNRAHQKSTVATNFPSWAARGSYLVCRRLEQDVAAFWNFAAQAASRVGVPPLTLAARLVGRWPSGAPLMRAPASDNAALAGDPFANNHFVFDDDTRPASMRTIPGYAGDTFDQAKADMLGAVCPHFAHIRKANPRDSATDLGKLEDTLTRLILRRGIPFGPPVVGVKRPSPKLLAQERGLMFVCYGSSIENQFEFLTRRWANSAIQPNLGGHDPIIGQRDQRGDRARTIDFPTGSGPVRVTLDAEWVTPTGGGYFFAPPIAALTNVLGA
jgi:Dyp-type peroxidase family